MTKFIKNAAIHPLLIGIYPVLALLSFNISQLEIWVVWRSLISALLISILVLGIAFAVFRNWQKAALAATTLLVSFYSYGHVYQLFKGIGAKGNFFLAHHSILFPLFLILTALVLFWLLFRVKQYSNITYFLNIISIAVILVAFVPIAAYTISLSSKEKARNVPPNASLSLTKPLTEMPDIYFIVLDSYTRADALLDDFELDISPFQETMRGMGFYEADCARSNYSFTELSLASAFNMDYLDTLNPEMVAGNGDLTPATALIQNNIVRRQLEYLGYKTVAFETGYVWNHWNDADLYLSPNENPLFNAELQPFEEMLVRTTMVRVLADTRKGFFNGSIRNLQVKHHDVHVKRTFFTLKWLEKMPDVAGPKFVYAHLNVPHVPFIFRADGSLQTDENYYKGDQDYPTSEKYFVDGYRSQVEFINNVLPPVIQKIIDGSKTPPVIVVQGDHGIRNDNRYEILNLYRYPGFEAALYPAITPINSFRVLFNGLFNGKYPLLDDHSYLSTYEKPYDLTEQYETAEGCKK